MMRKLFLILASGLALGTSTLFSAPINQQSALKMAKEFFIQRQGLRSGNDDLQVTFVAVNPEKNYLRSSGNSTENLYYVINRGNDRGFVIIAGDDRVKPLLAYSESGRMNREDMQYHPSIKALLNEYENQMIWALKHVPDNAFRTAGVLPSRIKVHIQPLLNLWYDRKTQRTYPIRFGQDWPFNRYSPNARINGRTYPTVSGCVATGISTVLRWHQWPDHPKGKVSYKWKGRYRMELNLDTCKGYDWKVMPANVSAHGYNAATGKICTEEESDNIGRLLRDVGYSVMMDYNPAFKGGSGTQIYYAEKSLINNFKYKNSCKWLSRDDFEDEKWYAQIYDELKNYGPVIYGGFSNGGGHCFVLDGIAEQGYVHVDWGWNGMEDGWYLLDILKPGSEGIGGGSGGYSYHQQMIRYLIPDRKINPNPNPQPTPNPKPEKNDVGKMLRVLSAPQDATLQKATGQKVNVKIKNTDTKKSFNNRIGLAIKPASSDNNSASIIATENISLAANTEKALTFKVDLSQIETGKYDIILAYHNKDGKWEPMTSNGKNAIVGSINVVETKPEPTPQERAYKLFFTPLTNDIRCNQGTEQTKISISISNNGNLAYDNEIRLYATPGEVNEFNESVQENCILLASGNAKVENGQTVVANFYANTKTLDAQNYTIILSYEDKDGNETVMYDLNKGFAVGKLLVEKKNDVRPTPDNEVSVTLKMVKFYQFGKYVGKGNATIAYGSGRNNFTTRVYLHTPKAYSGPIRIFVAESPNSQFPVASKMKEYTHITTSEGQTGYLDANFSTSRFYKNRYYINVQFKGENGKWYQYSHVAVPFWIDYNYYDQSGVNDMALTDGEIYSFDDKEINIGCNKDEGQEGNKLQSATDVQNVKTAVYPTSTSSTLHINTDKAQTASIYDMTGKKVKTITLNSGTNEISVVDLPVGNYLIRINTTTYRFNKIK